MRARSIVRTGILVASIIFVICLVPSDSKEPVGQVLEKIALLLLAPSPKRKRPQPECPNKE